MLVLGAIVTAGIPVKSVYVLVASAPPDLFTIIYLLFVQVLAVGKFMLHFFSLESIIISFSFFYSPLLMHSSYFKTRFVAR